MAKKDNHPIRNIYYMLSYAFQALKEMGYKDVAAEDFDNIHDLFAEILIRGTTAQIKRGLYKDYIKHEETFAGARGRILVSEIIKRQTLQQAKLVCSYDEFSSDSLHNQALKSVMLLLLRHGNVNIKSKNALRRILLYFSEISDVRPDSIRWDDLKYHRNNASYRMLLGICRLTVKGLLLSTETGSYRLANWIQTEEMHRLYEKFVFNYYKTEHNELSVRAPNIDWDFEDSKSGRYWPRMETDIVLQKADKMLIIDTKYYSSTMQSDSRYDSIKVISGHLYQIYAYVKNSDRRATGNVSGILLYAMTDELVTPNEDVKIGGNRIGLKTLDLGKEWEEITGQLDELCDWLG